MRKAMEQELSQRAPALSQEDIHEIISDAFSGP